MNDATPFEAAPHVPAPPNGARFLGVERAFWRLQTRGSILLAVTLGIYRFWLATDTRCFLWNNTEVAGEVLEYIGTARELLIGFLIAIVFLVPLYAAFYLGALLGGTAGQLFSSLPFVFLAALGQFAVYRARRYRLSRTVYRGLRFHQTGSAVRYAICAIFWWAMIGLTLGLAYPFAQASLERFKLRHTWYGNLQGDFVGSGWRLFFGGVLFWFVVVGPLVLGLMAAVGSVDWDSVGEAMKRGTEGLRRLEGAGAAAGVAFAVLALTWSVIAVAVLYPAFQAMMMRWWLNGIRFGDVTVTSHLRTGAVYGLYWRFVWMSLLLGCGLGVVAALAFGAVWAIGVRGGDGVTQELAQTAILIGAYVFAALAYSVVYQATVKLRLWQRCFESIELTNVELLVRVKASPASGSAVGEGFADALHVGGI